MNYQMTFMVETLADAAAFESLANELDVKMELQSVAMDESEQTESKRTRRRRQSPNRLTSAVINEILRIKNQYPDLTGKQIKKHLGLPHGVSTICRVIQEHRVN